MRIDRGAVTIIHRCRTHTKHRATRARALCEWPRAHWIAGEGEWALLAHCRVLTVSLHESREGAESDRAYIDQHGCGAVCYRSHDVVRLTQ